MPPSKSLTPIKCSEGVKGKSKYLTDYSGFKAGDDCSSPQHKYHGKCRFYPDEEQGSAVWLASLMFRTNVEAINTFCRDNVKSESVKHLKHAPTIHNLKCGRRSIWDIAKESDDLSNRSQTIFEDLEVEVVMETARRIVVAIDLSTSMSLADRFVNVVKAASKFLQSAAIGTYIVR